MSDLIQIQNSKLKVQITTLGAEIKSLYSQAWNKEIVWSGDPAIWDRSAPILFPIVGSLIENEYIYGDATYKLPRHGFARDSLFSLINSEINTAEFILATTQSSFAKYPFVFELRVRYSLNNSLLTISYKVKNVDNKDIYFSIGAHPGFRTDSIDQYELEFEKKEEEYYLLDGNLVNFNTPIAFQSKYLSLSDETFSRDAIIFKKLNSSYIDLKNKADNQIIRLKNFTHSHFGIWAKKGQPFICLEPWCGVADLVGHNKDLLSKSGIIKLIPSEEHEMQYQIELLEL